RAIFLASQAYTLLHILRHSPRAATPAALLHAHLDETALLNSGRPTRAGAAVRLPAFSIRCRRLFFGPNACHSAFVQLGQHRCHNDRCGPSAQGQGTEIFPLLAAVSATRKQNYGRTGQDAMDVRQATAGDRSPAVATAPYSNVGFARGRFPDAGDEDE